MFHSSSSGNLNPDTHFRPHPNFHGKRINTVGHQSQLVLHSSCLSAWSPPQSPHSEAPATFFLICLSLRVPLLTCPSEGFSSPSSSSSMAANPCYSMRYTVGVSSIWKTSYHPFPCTGCGRSPFSDVSWYFLKMLSAI